MNKNYPVSIIVPIYKVEQYIAKCLHSLFLQTYPHIEYIFVDDKGEDNSISILYEIMKKYPHRIDDIRILHHSSNKGLATARNTGIQASTGKYILQIDSDDYVAINMVEKMYTKAIAHEADIVMCDYYLQFKNKNIYRTEIENTIDEKITHILLRQFHYNSPMVWNKLIKRSLYIDYDIHCLEGYDLGEDTLVMPQLLYYASMIVHIHEPFVHYVQYNANSITRNKYAYDGFMMNLKFLEEKFKQLCIYEKFEQDFCERKILVTTSVLCSRLGIDEKKYWMLHNFPKKQGIKINFLKLHTTIFQKIILYLFIYKIEFVAQALLHIFPKLRKGRI